MKRRLLVVLLILACSTLVTGQYLSPNAKPQYLDNAGVPVAAGKLFTYVAGTTTPATTYSDSLLTTPNANPIILDSAGRVPTSIYLVTNNAYKYVLQTSAGATLWTQDNISLQSIAVPPAPQAVPTGALVMYSASSAPSGYLLCDGSAVSRSTYAALFAVIGTTYGVGDGSTTFNLPDMRQRFPMGLAASGTGNVLGGTGGTIDHTHTSAAHTHTFSVSGTTGVESADTSGVQGGSGVTSPAQNHTHSFSASGTTASTTPGNTGTANPPFQTVTFIIRTGL